MISSVVMLWGSVGVDEFLQFAAQTCDMKSSSAMPIIMLMPTRCFLTRVGLAVCSGSWVSGWWETGVCAGVGVSPGPLTRASVSCCGVVAFAEALRFIPHSGQNFQWSSVLARQNGHVVS